MALDGERSFSAPAKRSDLEVLPQSQRFSVGPAADSDLPELAAMLAAQIPSLQGTYLAFEQVHRHSRSILAIRNSNARRRRYRRECESVFRRRLRLRRHGFETR
jgi:hypothetical protein